MRKNAFTLIELLVVISIIAVLSTIGLTTFSGVQKNARDSVRKNDLNQLSTALEVYLQKNGHYVLGGGTCADIGNFYDPTNGIGPYMNGGNIPHDPSGSPDYCYESIRNGVSYQLFAKLENTADSNINLQNCSNSSYNYTKTSEDLSPACPSTSVFTAPAPTTAPTVAPTAAPTLPPCTPRIWYKDADGDRFGDNTKTLSSCTQPSGYITNNQDCNDANYNVHPGQTDYFTGSYNGSWDYDCDGAVTADPGTSLYITSQYSSQGYVDWYNSSNCTTGNLGKGYAYPAGFPINPPEGCGQIAVDQKYYKYCNYSCVCLSGYRAAYDPVTGTKQVGCR